jgi:ribonuclease HI/probable phosphoglycerate mutase
VDEYRAVLRGVSTAVALGADELELVGDSELVARQLSGAYRVKNAALKPLYQEALRSLRGLRWQIRTVPREQNSRADALVNAALDGQ